MYHVLLAIDADEGRTDRALRTVLELPGQEEEVSVTVLYVLEEFSATDEGGQIDSKSIYDESSIPETVEDAQNRLTDAGIETDVRHEHGDVSSTILNVAEELDVDCIAMSGRKQSPTGKVLFGSVTQSVLLASNRPVLISMAE